MKLTAEQLFERQSWTLDRKIEESQHRIEQWFGWWRQQGRGVYVSFSGGKDSTVLLHMVRNNPFLVKEDIPAVFVDTGLEFPEIREFVKTVPNVVWLRPKMSFLEVIRQYGWPVVSKEVSEKVREIRTTKSDKLRDKRMHGDEKGNGRLPLKWRYMIDAPFPISEKCCDVMKKNPVKAYERETKRAPYVGTMAGESRLRLMTYLQRGCNSFEGDRPMSTPMSFWLESDVWGYIRHHGLQYASVYDHGEDRTGCLFCLFGAHRHEETRYDRLARTHPKLHAYLRDVLGIEEPLRWVRKAAETTQEKKDEEAGV
jgi:3'-phosphoadenosine 5'-phosphosulfate sulfotransferase (PAPS reductase)/FAD synthetase